MLKALTVVVAGVLSVLAIRQVLAANEAAKARVKAKRPDATPAPARRLRQDPATGIYYPEN